MDSQIMEITEEEEQVKDLVIAVELDPVDLFERGCSLSIVEAIREQSLSIVSNVSTEQGRADIKDISKKIRKCSKIMDDLGKDHVKALKSRPKTIDSNRKEMRDDLDDLDALILLPLITYENDLLAKKQAIENKINAMRVMPVGVLSPRAATVEDARIFLAEIEATEIDDSYGDSKDSAGQIKAENILMLQGIIARFDIEAKEAAEAESARIEAEASQRKASDERIAKAAADKATKDSEQAVINAKAEADKAKQDAIDAKEREELAKKQAEHNAKLKAEKAVQDEKDRVEKERLAEVKKKEKLSENKRHSAKINNEILKAMILSMSEVHTSTTSDAKKIAKSIITAMAKRKIPHVTITY